MIKCGIYKILNIKTNKIYIGSSNNIRIRWTRHKHELRKGIHPNPYLQNSFNKYGEGIFVYTIIEETKESRLLSREQYWIDKLNACDRLSGYNISPKSSGGPPKRYTTCTIESCDRPHLAKGLCNKHYRRLRRNGDTSDKSLKGLPPIKNRGCKVKNCKEKHDSNGYCNRHSYYIRKYGKIIPPKLTFDPGRGCSTNGCNGKHQAKGLCHKCYERKRYRNKKLNY